MTTEPKPEGYVSLNYADIAQKPKVGQNNDTEMQVAKEAPITKEKPKSVQEDDKRYEILSKRMSYWIDVTRAMMIVCILTCHYEQDGSQDYTSNVDFYLPHILVSNGWGTVRDFFLLAGFFTMFTFDRMQKKYIKDTKQFIKQFVFQQFKRYFQLHAVIFMWGLGMGSFYAWVMGEAGNYRHFAGPRTLRYWIDFYMPMWWPGRVWDSALMVTGSSWYINNLQQMESLFYIAFFITYFLRKKMSDFAYGLTFSIGMLAILGLIQLIWSPELHFDSFFYMLGVIVYWLRMALIRTDRGKRIVDFIYSPDRLKKIIVWTVSLVLAWVWMVVNRCMYFIHMVFLGVIVLFDLFPYGKLPSIVEKFVNELKRMQMEIFLTHQMYFWKFDIRPRFFPQILPRDTSVIRPTYVHWFVSWLLTIQVIALSYPIHFVCKPLDSIPQWIYDVYTKKERKSDFWKNYWMSIAGLSVGFLLIILNHANAYGN